MTIQTKPKLLLINRPTKSVQAWKDLQEAADVVVIEQLTHDEQAELIKKTVEEQGPFAAWGGFIDFSRPYPAPFDEALLKALAQTTPPTRLYVGPGAGYDRVDIPFITKSGAYYANSPKEVGVRTADGTVALILAVARGLQPQHHSVAAGRWRDTSVVAKDLRSSTIGIVGMGSIGRQVADILSSAFGAKIIYFNRRKDESAPYELVSLDELLERSDVISLNCPLTPETRDLIGAEEFAKMKDGVLFINTARGKVIVEDELVKALKSGKVLRAGLDVFEDEPNVHPELLDNPNVTLSPHILALNETLLPALEIEMAANIIEFIKTGKPNTPVNVKELELAQH